ncbi:hypothetical protein AVEN_238386-1 [Araneus ventricosus]|uniref:Endonuclease/exonuclease/phosphatase domain-containing protein n=1 Tax=Araneus ventricosus TaxID=182803 RepID=A0A4Y2DP54_ARAVE|nr:hypothetical protein AVEN_238386-1 [Araneus ventricosus]
METQELLNLCFSNKIPDVFLLQEPYLKKGKVIGFPLNWRIVAALNGKAIIIIRNKNLSILTRCVSQNTVIADISDGTQTITVVSVYIPHSSNKNSGILKFEDIFRNINFSHILIGGDFNMRHELWGPEIHNHRISDQAAPLVSFILKYGLIIWNDKDSEPTFETVNGKSITTLLCPLPTWLTRKLAGKS